MGLWSFSGKALRNNMGIDMENIPSVWNWAGLFIPTNARPENKLGIIVWTIAESCIQLEVRGQSRFDTSLPPALNPTPTPYSSDPSTLRLGLSAIAICYGPVFQMHQWNQRRLHGVKDQWSQSLIPGPFGSGKGHGDEVIPIKTTWRTGWN